MIGLRRHDQKARGVVLVVFNMAGQHRKSVNFSRHFTGKGGPRDIARLGNFACSAGIVGTHFALDAMLFQKAGALRQDHHMAMRLAHVGQFGPLDPQKIDMNAHKGFVHDVQTSLWQKRMHVSHPPIGRVFDGKHAKIDLARTSQFDHIFEGLTGHWREIGPRLCAGLMRIGPKLPLKCDAS